jgi:hypothetical protein
VTPHQILVVVIRLLAILWALHLLTLISPTFAALEQSEDQFATLWVPLLLQFIACVWLWIFPATLAAKLLRSGSSQVRVSDTSLAEWQNLALIAVGVFVLAGAVPDAIYWLILVIGGLRLAPAQDIFNLEQKANALATLVEIAIGVWLVFGASGIGAFVHRLRAAGVPAQRP